MNKRVLYTTILIAYSALLVKIMVFKDLPLISIGPRRFRFGGAQDGAANFLPFKTILFYLLGAKGSVIGFINLVGNIALLVPVGFLFSFVYQNVTWKKSLIVAVTAGFAIEGMQAVLRVGIFDIDDVLLNALGVMLGYWAFTILAKWRVRKSVRQKLNAEFIRRDYIARR
jgi:glycopeptide antibiotics resistance protein